MAKVDGIKSFDERAHRLFKQGLNWTRQAMEKTSNKVEGENRFINDKGYEKLSEVIDNIAEGAENVKKEAKKLWEKLTS